MFQKKIFQILMLPFTILYGIGVAFNDFIYRTGIVTSSKFDLPTIVVGNLTMGGAGKTPHIEFLIKLLKPHIRVATLSRGYKRKTKGFRIVNINDNAKNVGDEPIQFKRKNPEIVVTVAENRVFAIPEILQNHPEVQLILLDDAFQHRALDAYLKILLTEFNLPFYNDFLLPSGRLREWRDGYKRADAIIISKCPADENLVDRGKIEKKLNLLAHQVVFYTYYKYGNPYYIFNGNQRIKLEEDVDVLMLCAIAKPEYLEEYLKEKCNSVLPLKFDDHHYFENRDIARMEAWFKNIESKKKVIITTEKDATRLELHRSYLLEKKIPIFVLPIIVDFHFNQIEDFNNFIKQQLLNYKS